MSKEKIKENLENIAGPLTSLCAGTGFATIDVLISGTPILSLGLAAYEFAKIFSVPKEYDILDCFEKKSALKNWGFYLLGVTIPLGIKYAPEISGFIEGVLK